MKLTVLVPSEDYRASAGARIRYGGLAQGLGGAGITLSLEPIATFDPSSADCDALLISKCHDARSIIAAAVLSRRGKIVGVDLFDDYFSQRTDSRVVRYRDWLSDLLQDCDFCLCSTKTMAQVVRDYKPGLPIHVVNDPARDHVVEDACRLADAKAAEARRDQMLRVTWFGVGDNPYFKVGLFDILAHSWVLSELTRSGMAVELTLLTNRRALQADGLELISRLPVPCKVMEWSEAVERAVLEESFLAFLPVGAQAFSAAKSLNRAWTGLTHGCQVLSYGHPLYTALDPLIYRQPEELIADLADDRLRLSTRAAGTYSERLNAVGSADREALRLAAFLEALTPKGAGDDARLVVVHGLATRAEVHNMAQSVGGLSVASPYCSAKLNFDVSFSGPPGEMKMASSSRDREGSRSSRPAWLLQTPTQRSLRAGAAPIPYQLATYAPAMAEVRQRLEAAFGPIRMIVSETSRLPVSAFSRA